jgi:hypothetical protein
LDKHLDDGFFLAPRFNGEADSSESDESSESEDGGDGAIAVFALALALLAGALFFLAPPGFVLSANGEAGDSSESDDGIKASESEERGDGAIVVFALAFLALRLDGPSLASSAAAATEAGGATVGASLASSAAAATSAGGATVGAAVNEGGAAAAPATAEGGATVRAADLIERRRMGLPPTAGSVADTDSEGGVFLAMTHI